MNRCIGRPAGAVEAVGRLEAGLALSHQPARTEAAGETNPVLNEAIGAGETMHLQRRTRGGVGANRGAGLLAAVVEAVVVHEAVGALGSCSGLVLVLSSEEINLRQRCMVLQSCRWREESAALHRLT
jgi:hypothetical protein